MDYTHIIKATNLILSIFTLAVHPSLLAYGQYYGSAAQMAPYGFDAYGYPVMVGYSFWCAGC